ncbi:hypothetical protein APHAL10511_008685 [Amanita phalloides]|nr:hypothetical protein APHAL10511_008685 [Amanita phalloides]
MKKLAARDYEDLLQCALPVFEGLLPYEFDTVIQDLLFKLCTWHALAKLHLHTESTVHALERSSQCLGFALQDFKKKVCSCYMTKELPSEEAACGCHNAALTKTGLNNSTDMKNSKKEHIFNLSTYKLHALADYPSAICRYGTTDGFTSQVGKAQHKCAKQFYSHTSKAEHTRSIARQQRQQKTLQKLHEHYIAIQWNQPGMEEDHLTVKNHVSPALGAKAENLSLTDPNCHYHMATDTKNKINIRAWPGDELEDDPACKDFLPQLLDHLLSHLLGTEYDRDEMTFSSAQHSMVTICNNLIYSHQVLRVNYTTYDLRREQDTINIRTKPNVMLLSREDSPNEDGLQYHPYWYAHIIGIFHTYIIHTGPESKGALPQWMDFLWVHWFGWDNDRSGWKFCQLLKLGFFDSQSPGAFGFVDPALII